MNNQHPITPPPELVQQWLGEQYGRATVPGEASIHVANQAAQWGADQELEACCEWLELNYNYTRSNHPLRTARRPNSPSLKEQAFEALSIAVVENEETFSPAVKRFICKALEELPDDN